MINLGIRIIIAIFMFVSPFQNLKDQLKFDLLENTSLTPFIIDHEIQVVKIAPFLELSAAKTLAAQRVENSMLHTIKSDQALRKFIEHFLHDKHFLVVKKFQSNYLSKK